MIYVISSPLGSLLDFLKTQSLSSSSRAGARVATAARVGQAGGLPSTGSRPSRTANTPEDLREMELELEEK